MLRSYVDKQAYTDQINRLKQENLEEISRDPKYKKLIRLLKTGQFDAIWARLREMIWGLKKRNSDGIIERECVNPDYFSDEKIAVYTVVFGDYDALYEPKCCPDNCSFFLISDCGSIPPESSWKRLVLPEEIRAQMRGMNNIEKNRFLKMMPHLLFPDFNYSVYLDGNVQMVTDPTEFINRMPPWGMSSHLHVSRTCVYEEAKAILLQKKAAKEDMEDVVAYLEQERMPKNYGLLECPVLVRRHNQPECKKLMEEWWELFERFPFRDQMLLPLVLYRNGIGVEEVAWLGTNVRHSPSFRQYTHSR